MFSRIIATGSYLPEEVITNYDLEKKIDTSHDWIYSRTGIEQRHISNKLTSELATNAAKKALEKSKLDKSDIDMIIVATTTPDRAFPAVATKVQANLDINNNCPAFDVQAVCAGFIFALSVADNYIKSGQCNNILVIGAEKMSSILDWNDRSTCVLFGDGAGAVILSKSEETGILSTNIFSDGKYNDILLANGGIGMQKEGTVEMNGKEVFKHAVENMSNAVKLSLAKLKLSIDDIDYVIPHQANIRIINKIAQKMSIPDNKIIKTVNKHANTSAASIPLALDYAVESGLIKKDNLIAFQAIGGGLSWGSAILKW